MFVDAITLAAVADEWRTLLAGARIDTIIQPTEHALAIQCYAPAYEGQGGKNLWLYLSAHPQLARAHITALKPPRIASEPPAFVMLLRKYLEGTRIESIEQPRWERTLTLVSGHRRSPESDERIRYRLIIEIMGRLSNIVFCDEQGSILGCLKRVGADVNRYRVIAPGVPYVPPPPQQRTLAGQSLPRLEPTTVTASQLSLSVAEEAPVAEPEHKKQKKQPEKPKLWQVLARNLLGCSPLLAREMVYRATEDAEALVEKATQEMWEELAWNVRDLASIFDAHAWHPQLVERRAPEEHDDAPDAPTGAPVAFAPYRLEQYANQPELHVHESPSMNVLLDDYYARTEWHNAVDAIRAPMRKILQVQRERCLRKAEILREEMNSAEEAAQYRLQAELLLAQQHEVHKGAGSVALPNIYEDTGSGDVPLVTIPLDPRFDAVGNANRLFTRYHKLRRAVELVPEQTEQNNLELATVNQLLTDLTLAETPAEVDLVKAEIQEAGYIRGKALQEKKTRKGKGGKPAKKKPALPGGGVPLHMQTPDGFAVLVGKNSRQNEEVTFRQATSNDVWLHARGVAGAHVIIKAAGRTIPRSTIEQVAKVAAYYSEARGSTAVPVDYTLQRNVRHMKGGGPGMVVYEREQTLYAEPSSELS